MWTVTDQGVQHVYGSGDRDATSEVMPATYTDHDFLYVRARLASPARGPS
jgi:hypothetical protein